MFKDLYAREGYMEDDTFDWTTVQASKSTRSAAAALANVPSAKHKPPAAKPKDKVEVKVKLADGLVDVVQRDDLILRPHKEWQTTQGKNDATGQLGPVKARLAARENVVSKAKPVPEKPTADEPEPKTRPKVLNKIAIATKPIPALANSKAKPLVVKPGPVKSPPCPVVKAEPKAKLASKPNHRKIERIPVRRSPSPSIPSVQLDMDEVLEKIGDLKISDKRESTQGDAKESGPRHVNSGDWKDQAQEYTPPPPPARPNADAVKRPGPKQAALKPQPANPAPAVKETLSREVIKVSSDLDVAKQTKPGAVPTRRIPLRMHNVNTKPLVALIHSSPQRRKNPPRLVNVNTNAKSPPRRRVMVTRAAAGRKEG